MRDDDPAAVALLENLQREDLTPLEAALAISALIDEKGLTHQDVAGLIHKSRPYVSNTLALTRLLLALFKQTTGQALPLGVGMHRNNQQVRNIGGIHGHAETQYALVLANNPCAIACLQAIGKIAQGPGK